MPINFASRSVVLFFIVSLIVACDATSRYGFNAGTVDAGGESVDDDTNSVETSAESADAETSVNVSGDNSDGSIPIIPDSEGAFELGLLSGDLKIEIENTFIKLGWNNSDDYDYYHLAVSYDDGDVFESIKSEDVKNPIEHKLNISRLHSTIYKVTACSTDTQDNCPGTTDLAHDTKSIQITDYIDQIEANYIKDMGTLGNNAEFGIGVALSDDGETLAVAIGKGDYNANFLESREIGQASIYKNPIGGFGTSSDFAKAPNGYSVMVVNPTLEKVTDVALSGDGGIVAMVSPSAVIAYTLDDDMSSAPLDFSSPDDYEGEAGTDHTLGNLSLSDDGMRFVVRAWDSSENSTPAFAYAFEKIILPDFDMPYIYGYININNVADSENNGSASLSGDGNTRAIAVEGVGVYLFTYSGTSYQLAGPLLREPEDATKFASSVSLSDDGKTLAVASRQADDEAGAVYIYKYADNEWGRKYTLQKDDVALYASSISLSGDGSALAVGAPGESSSASNISLTGLTGSLNSAGAVYLYALDDGVVKATTYIKASNPDANDLFGTSVALSDDGGTLAVGAIGEDGIGRDVNKGDPDNNELINSGAVYLY